MIFLILLYIGSFVAVLSAVKLDVKTSVVVQLPVRNFTFPCRYTDTDKQAEYNTIQWTKFQSKEGDWKILIEKQSNGEIVKHRDTSCELDGCSLVLMSPTSEDTGLYSVTLTTHVKSSVETSGKAHTTSVEESAQVLATFFEKPEVLCLDVIIPTSISWLSVKIPVSNITLPCNYTLGNREDFVIIEWRRDSQNGPLVLLSSKDQSSPGQPYNGRVEMGHGCSLVILEPQPEDSGTYSVSVRTMDSSQEWTDVYLELSAQDQTLCSTVSVVILVVGILLCVISGCGVLWVCHRHRRRSDEQDGEEPNNSHPRPSTVVPSDSGNEEPNAATPLSSGDLSGEDSSGGDLNRQTVVDIGDQSSKRADNTSFVGVSSTGLRRRKIKAGNESDVAEADPTETGGNEDLESDKRQKSTGDKLLLTTLPSEVYLGSVGSGILTEPERWSVIPGLGRHLCISTQTNDEMKNYNLKLHVAVRNGDLEKCRQVLDSGFDVNQQDNGKTALHVAAENGFVEITNLLLKAKARTDIHNDFGDSCLITAAVTGHREVCQELITAGIDVNHQNVHGVTAFAGAAENGHKDVIYLLLSYGAQSELLNENKDTCLIRAAWNGQAEVCKLPVLLGTGDDIKRQNKNGNTALHCAAWKGHIETVDLLLKKGAQPTIRNKLGNAPLHLAAMKGHVQVADLLLKAKADRHIVNNTEETPLSLAEKSKNEDLIVLLKTAHHTS